MKPDHQAMFPTLLALRVCLRMPVVVGRGSCQASTAAARPWLWMARQEPSPTARPTAGPFVKQAPRLERRPLARREPGACADTPGRRPALHHCGSPLVAAWAVGLLTPWLLFAQNPAIEELRYPDSAAARAVWKPMDRTAPVALATLDGRPALQLPCNFAGTKIERASWDRAVQLDLSACRGVEFQVLCRDSAPVRYFSLYFQSGEGWYHASFFPETTNAWDTITLDKSAFSSEGQPAGWGKIRTLRLSAWRGADVSTEFFLRDFRLTGALGGDALVAIVRSDSAAKGSAADAAERNRYTETTAGLLAGCDVGYSILSDLELTAERLKLARVVILPHNPDLPDTAAEALLSYVRDGGKLIAFYTVPEQLRSVLQIADGNHVREPRPGYFAAIRCQTNALPGAPAVVSQHSWNINSVKPVAGASRTLAEWFDDQGQPTGHAAIIGSTNWLLMTHVLLSDDSDNQRRLLLAMVGQLAPEVWLQALRASLRRSGEIGPCKTLEETSAAIAKTAPNNLPAAKALASARAARDSATELASRREFASALDQIAVSRERLREAWCLAQPSLPGEFRAFWCHDAFGVRGMDWDEAIRRLAASGFTAILPNMLWGGVAYYDSQVLPVAPEVAQRGDQIAQCLAACRKYGIQVHVWKVNWNLGHNAPKAWTDKLRSEHRLQVSSGGKEEPWLCPSQPDNQKLEIDSMLEVARRYDVDGLHFDYIRYPDEAHCYCDGCKERFQRATKTTVAQWPKDVQGDAVLRPQWLDWRRSHITAVVQAVAEQAHALKPKMKISAAVFRDWPQDRDSVGQDWKLWCDRGWLDFVCPMDYTLSHRQFENMVRRQVEWAGRVPCYPGIGESASNSRLGADGVIEQILITRRYKTGGFTIFNYGAVEAKELLPMLGLGITAK